MRTFVFNDVYYLYITEQVSSQFLTLYRTQTAHHCVRRQYTSSRFWIACVANGSRVKGMYEQSILRFCVADILKHKDNIPQICNSM